MLSLGLNGDRYDSWGGRLGWSAVLSAGDNDLSGDQGYAALDDASARTGGGFQKLNLAVSRLSRLDKAGDYQLAVSLSAQLASKNLDNSEKLQLGGPNGIRAYPMGEGLGDDGWLANAEVRTSLGKFAGADVTLFGFVDAGGIKQYKHTWNGALLAGKPNQYTLAGAGVGMKLSYDDKGGVSITVANKLGNNPNQSANNTDADGRNRAARVWVIGNIAF
jgi:hemolysin activation/secretion protein